MLKQTILLFIIIFFQSCGHYDVNKITHHDMQEYLKSRDYTKNVNALLAKPVSYNNRIQNELDLVFFYFLKNDYIKSQKLIENIERKIENSTLDSIEEINKRLVSKETNKYMLEEHEYVQLQAIKIMMFIMEKQFTRVLKIKNIYKNSGIYYLQGIGAELNKEWDNAIVLYKKSSFLTKNLDIERVEGYKKGYPIINETIIFYNSGLSPIKTTHETHPTIPTYKKRLNLKNIYEISSKEKNYVSIPLINFYNLAKQKEIETYKSNVYEDIVRFSYRELLALPIDLITSGGLSIGTRLLLHVPDGGDFRYWEWSFEQIDIARIQFKNKQDLLSLKTGNEIKMLPNNPTIIINNPI